jgi:hypothetical protein
VSSSWKKEMKSTTAAPRGNDRDANSAAITELNWGHKNQGIYNTYTEGNAIPATACALGWYVTRAGQQKGEKSGQKRTNFKDSNIRSLNKFFRSLIKQIVQV